jgi:hypothetical protein
MDYLRTAPFGGLFAVAFTVGTLFHFTLGIVGLGLAAFSPELFNAPGRPISGEVEAAGVVIFMLIFAMAVNAAVSALGALIWVAVRRVYVRRPRA